MPRPPVFVYLVFLLSPTGVLLSSTHVPPFTHGCPPFTHACPSFHPRVLLLPSTRVPPFIHACSSFHPRVSSPRPPSHARPQARKLWGLLEKKYAGGDFSHTFGALDPVQVQNSRPFFDTQSLDREGTIVGTKYKTFRDTSFLDRTHNMAQSRRGCRITGQ